MPSTPRRRIRSRRGTVVKRRRGTPTPPRRRRIRRRTRVKTPESDPFDFGEDAFSPVNRRRQAMYIGSKKKKKGKKTKGKKKKKGGMYGPGGGGVAAAAAAMKEATAKREYEEAETQITHQLTDSASKLNTEEFIKKVAQELNDFEKKGYLISDNLKKIVIDVLADDDPKKILFSALRLPSYKSEKIKILLLAVLMTKTHLDNNSKTDYTNGGIIDTLKMDMMDHFGYEHEHTPFFHELDDDDFQQVEKTVELFSDNTKSTQLLSEIEAEDRKALADLPTVPGLLPPRLRRERTLAAAESVQEAPRSKPSKSSRGSRVGTGKQQSDQRLFQHGTRENEIGGGWKFGGGTG